MRRFIPVLVALMSLLSLHNAAHSDWCTDAECIWWWQHDKDISGTCVNDDSGVTCPAPAGWCCKQKWAMNSPAIPDVCGQGPQATWDCVENHVIAAEQRTAVPYHCDYIQGVWYCAPDPEQEYELLYYFYYECADCPV